MSVFFQRLPAAASLIAGALLLQGQTAQVSPSAYSISGWRVECATQSSALSCQLIDQVVERANNGVIASISVMQAGDKKTPMMVVQIPLGAALETPVQVGFEGGPQQTLPFFSCYSNGCFASDRLNDTILTQMRGAKQPLAVSYATLDRSMNRQTIRITLPLDGFAVAYDKLK